MTSTTRHKRASDSRPEREERGDSTALEDLARTRVEKASTSWMHRAWKRWILPRITDPLRRQRVKICYFGWGYLPLLWMRPFSWRDRVGLLARFLRVDWNVLHAHRPAQIVHVVRALAERPARENEVMVEAGCWQGGSSAKFSAACQLLGYRLWIFDSFEGVEALSGRQAREEWDYAGQYASSEARLWQHLQRYGVSDLCSTSKGWFSQTLAQASLAAPVRVAFIDCDLAQGTREALQGVIPALSADGYIFSQDFHIEPVRRLLLDGATWAELGVPQPRVEAIDASLARLRFEATRDGPATDVLRPEIGRTGGGAS